LGAVVVDVELIAFDIELPCPDLLTGNGYQRIHADVVEHEVARARFCRNRVARF